MRNEKVKWEEQLNKILDAVLNSNSFKEIRKDFDLKEDIEFYGVQRRKTDVELDLLENFFEQDLEQILQVNGIWLWLKDKIRDEIADLTSDAKTFLKEGIYFEMEEFVNEKINNLWDNLSGVYLERLESEWKGLKPEQAEPKLPKGQVYVALLDNGLLTREPYPITRNTEAKLSWRIREEEVMDRWAGTKRKERNLIVKIKPPPETYTAQSIRLKPDETSATTIKT